MVPILVSMSDVGSGPDTQADIIVFWSLVGLVILSSLLLGYTIWKTK